MNNNQIKKSNKRTSRKKKTFRVPRTQVYPFMPPVFHVKLRRRDFDTGSAVASPVYLTRGFLEPITLTPLYQAAFFTMYGRARIHASKISVMIINTGSEPIELVTAVLPYNWVSGTPTIAEIRNKPGAVRKIVSGAGGLDRASIVMQKTSAAILGSPAYLSDFDFDATQAAAGTPIISDEPAWVMAFSALNSASGISYRLEYTLEWSYEFFNQTAT